MLLWHQGGSSSGSRKMRLMNLALVILGPPAKSFHCIWEVADPENTGDQNLVL